MKQREWWLRNSYRESDKFDRLEFERQAVAAEAARDMADHSPGGDEVLVFAQDEDFRFWEFDLENSKSFRRAVLPDINAFPGPLYDVATIARTFQPRYDPRVDTAMQPDGNLQLTLTLTPEAGPLQMGDLVALLEVERYLVDEGLVPEVQWHS